MGTFPSTIACGKSVENGRDRGNYYVTSYFSQRFTALAFPPLRKSGKILSNINLINDLPRVKPFDACGFAVPAKRALSDVN